MLMRTQDEFDGYTIAYDREELPFPVYLMIVVGASLVGLAFARSSVILFAPGLVCLIFAYYNAPLLERGRPRLGAGQYGMFVEGLGVIPWRAIESIELALTPLRGYEYRELRITLNRPVDAALMADWRKRPIWRVLMRLPWTMKARTIHIPANVFDREPVDIHATLLRMWRYFRA